jgi:AraC-like DNA-binding protein
MFTKIEPHPCLNNTVEYYWVEKCEKQNIRIIPDGTSNILFNIGDPIRLITPDGSYEELPGNIVFGPRTEYCQLELGVNTNLVGIKFKQSGAYNFFKTPMQKFKDRILDLLDLLNGESEKVRDLLLDAEVEGEIKRVLDFYLLIKADTLNVSKIVNFAIYKIKSGKPEFRIKEVCEEINVSNKHLITLFNKMVGITPRLLYRLIRFKKVIEITQSQKIINWPQVAYECNYYDQAHLVNDFRLFTGYSPAKYYDILRSKKENFRMI